MSNFASPKRGAKLNHLCRFADKGNAAFDPGICPCIAMVCKTSYKIVDQQTVVVPVDTGATQHPVGKDRVFIQFIQAGVMKLVYRDTFLVAGFDIC